MVKVWPTRYHASNLPATGPASHQLSTTNCQPLTSIEPHQPPPLLCLTNKQTDFKNKGPQKKGGASLGNAESNSFRFIKTKI